MDRALITYPGSTGVWKERPGIAGHFVPAMLNCINIDINVLIARAL